MAQYTKCSFYYSLKLYTGIYTQVVISHNFKSLKIRVQEEYDEEN